MEISIAKIDNWFTQTLSPSQWMDVLGFEENDYLHEEDGREVFDVDKIEDDAMRVWHHLPDEMKIKIFKENTKYFNISFNEASDMYTIVLAMLFNWDSKTRSTSVHNLTERDVKMLEEIKDRLHDYFKVHF